MPYRYDGPDISSFQPAADWPVVAAAGCRFAGIRLGHGPYSARPGEVRPGFIDRLAVQNVVEARAAGMRWRALYYVVTPLEEASAALERVQDFFRSASGRLSGDLIAIDYESNPNVEGEWCSPEQVEAVRAAFASEFGPGCVGIYSSRGYLDWLDLPSFGWRWLASYTLDAADAARARGCEVVQWTSSAVIAGVDAGRVDMNEVLDVAALDAAAGVAEVAVGSPIGSLDVVEVIRPGRVHVAGWSFDPDAPAELIPVHVYLNGALAGEVLADRERSDVNAAHGIAGDHGFDAELELTVPLQVDTYGINRGEGSNAHIGGRLLSVPQAPFDPEAVRALVRAEMLATPFQQPAPPGP